LDALTCIESSADEDLYILPFVEQEWSKSTMRWVGSQKRGPCPSEISASKALQAIYSQSSWFFGVWNRRSLLDMFPSQPFDWLDSHCVSNAILHGSTLEVPMSNRPVKIGTRDGPHHAVGSRHRPLKSLVHLGSMLGIRIFLRPRIAAHYFLVFLQRLFLAHKLNGALANRG
jgi:hypothetical protein